MLTLEYFRLGGAKKLHNKESKHKTNKYFSLNLTTAYFNVNEFRELKRINN